MPHGPNHSAIPGVISARDIVRDPNETAQDRINKGLRGQFGDSAFDENGRFNAQLAIDSRLRKQFGDDAFVNGRFNAGAALRNNFGNRPPAATNLGEQATSSFDTGSFGNVTVPSLPRASAPFIGAPNPSLLANAPPRPQGRSNLTRFLGQDRRLG
jgi:hypothetical protein